MAALSRLLALLMSVAAAGGHCVERALATVSPEDLLLAGRAAFLVFSFVLAAATFTRWRRAAERDSARLDARLALILERLEQLERLACGNEPRLTALGEQLEAHLNAASGPVRENSPIAIRLARAGAEPAELIARCGLTRPEAELVDRLHGGRKSPNGPRTATLAGDAAAA